MALTDAAIKALKPRAMRYLVTDGHGLALEVYPAGGMAWRYRYRLNGKLEKVALGKYPSLSLKVARRMRDGLATQVALGQSPSRQKQLRKVALASATTVQEFGERYFVDVVKRDRKDTKIVRRYLDKGLYPAFGNRPIGQVTAEDLQRIVFDKRDQGFPAAAADLRNLCKRMWEYALVRGVATTNPALALPVRFITKARARTRALSPDEIRIYLQSLYSSGIRRQFKLALHLILLTLVRKSELLFAQWPHVDFDADEWHIPAENSKTGKPHIVYLPRQASKLFSELKSLAGTSQWVLPGRSGPHKPFAHNALNKALDGVNIPIDPFTIHDLRRTGSTRLHEAGFASDVIEKALNHTIGGVRGIYNRAEYASQRSEMLQFWADYIDDLANEKKVVLGNFGVRSAAA
ncbi:MAG: integrase arm-type DNA-binding domain-containing protein [Rhodanobacteraceae bacterium]